ncbi:MAG: hypothetical protein II351_03260 [Clostridia bacterium]|nr:hypothetical protein [Clostridia bacterium]
MKKVRIDWNRTDGAWEATHNAIAEVSDAKALSALPRAAILRFNVEVDHPEQGLTFLKEASAFADELLLNLSGGQTTTDEYEQKVLPILKEASACPNLTYVEVDGNGVDADAYYACYRGAYHALAKLDRPLKLGGNGVYQLLNHADSWLFFLQHLAEDTDPLKRIDFYVYREALEDYSVRIWLMHEAHIAWLKEYGLPTLPIFIDGLVLTPEEQLTGAPEEALRNAASMISAVIAATEWPEFKLFLKSVCDEVPAYSQLDGDLQPTANGHAVTCLSKLSGERLVCDIIEESWPPQKDIVATKKDGALSVLICNPTDEPTYIKFTVADIPYAKLRVQKYLVDDRHNAGKKALTLTDGRIQAPSKIKNSENVEMLGGQDTREELDGTITVEANLREHAFCLYTFEEYK